MAEDTAQITEMESGTGVGEAVGMETEEASQDETEDALAERDRRLSGIEEALGLIPLQVRRWLERMEHGGEIERASRNPVTYALTRKTLL